MKRSTRLDAAYVHFAHAVGRLLESKGAASHCGGFKLNTPGGVFILWARLHWIFGRFENPVGGYIVTRGQSQEHSGRWATNFPDNVDALTAENVLAGFEYDLDRILGFELTDEQSQAISREAAARRRQAKFGEPSIYGESPVMAARQPFAACTAVENLARIIKPIRQRFDGASTPRPACQ